MNKFTCLFVEIKVNNFAIFIYKTCMNKIRNSNKNYLFKSSLQFIKILVTSNSIAHFYISIQISFIVSVYLFLFIYA